MTITTRDQLIAALGNNSDRMVIDKTSLANAVAGTLYSLWTAGGTPGAGAAPTAAALCTSALAGSFQLTNQTDPATTYLAWLALSCTNGAVTIEVHDRLAHIGGLSGTVTTLQSAALDLSASGVNVPAARLGASNYSDVQWWLEVFTGLGATGVNATVGVTYHDATTGNLNVQALGANPRAGRFYNLNALIPNGKYIRGITGVTLSATTGTAGNFGFTATRSRAVCPLFVANKSEVFDWASLGLPDIPNDSCLQLVELCSTTTTGAVRGSGKMAHG